MNIKNRVTMTIGIIGTSLYLGMVLTSLKNNNQLNLNNYHVAKDNILFIIIRILGILWGILGIIEMTHLLKLEDIKRGIVNILMGIILIIMPNMLLKVIGVLWVITGFTKIFYFYKPENIKDGIIKIFTGIAIIFIPNLMIILGI